ncbi:MAG: YaaR family protein [Spirochaetes bacterium]|nr:YaaR family protein [Spirochaetota bacterium]
MIENTDAATLYLNPAAYAPLKGEARMKSRPPARKEGVSFSSILDLARGREAAALDSVEEMQVSEEALNLLMDEVRNAGDILKSRPFPEEIMRYKQVVRNFMNFVVKNTYSLEQDEGIPKFAKPGFSRRLSSLDARERKTYTKIQVVDKKLEDLAAILLTSQLPQLEMLFRLEEIRGLLVDLLQ